jgi:hypothetical protein
LITLSEDRDPAHLERGRADRDCGRFENSGTSQDSAEPARQLSDWAVAGGLGSARQWF